MVEVADKLAAAMIANPRLAVLVALDAPPPCSTLPDAAGVASSGKQHECCAAWDARRRKDAFCVRAGSGRGECHFVRPSAPGPSPSPSAVVLFRGHTFWHDEGVSPVEWAPSAGRHNIPHADVLWAIGHAVGSEELESRTKRPGETVQVFVGRPHAQSQRFIEVIALIREPRTIVVFHAMELSDLYRHLTTEGE